MRTNERSACAVTHRQAGLTAFESGDLSAATAQLSLAVDLGAIDPDTIALLSTLISEREGSVALAAFYRSLLDVFGAEVSPSNYLAWATANFDALRAEPSIHPTDDQEAAALDLCSGAAAAAFWEPVLVRRTDLEGVMQSPARRLDLLEQFVYAPSATGLPLSAVAEIEALGYRAIRDHEIDRARTVERLLHGSRHAEAAYRVERARRRVTPISAHGPSVLSSDDRHFDGLTVLIAGGHPPLRRMVSVDFRRSGARGVREVPSKWEAVQSGRSVLDQMAGSDLAVLIGRQLAHSTADQVRTAAARYGVPVARAETAGVGSVRRAALGARPA